jgi:DNA invertase Pin-like site-specific DNA recombinase
MKPAISYSRYSSDEQANGTSIERQQELIEAHAKAHDLQVVNKLVDDGYSASKGEHVSHGEFGRFLKEADKGTYRGHSLIAERQDRLSRLGNIETNLLFYRLVTAGVIICLSEEHRIIKDIKDLDEMGTAILTTVRACADQEFSQKLSERVGRAWSGKQDAARASLTPMGKSLPGWLALEGQVKSANKIVIPGKIVVVPEKVALVREIYKLAAQGVGSRNICRRLHGRINSRSWVNKTLLNRAVLGEFQPGKSGEVIQGYYPQIISQTEFNDARAQMEKKRSLGKYVGGNRRNSATADNLFSGLLRDITLEPERGMDFQTVRQTHYVMTAFNSGAPSNRMRYDKLEKAITGFFLQVIWPDIANEGKSDEHKAAMAGLEAVKRERDIVERRLESLNKEMDTASDQSIVSALIKRIAKDETLLAAFTAQRGVLQASVAEAQAKTADLSETTTFFQLLNQLGSNPALRLPAKAAIAKKVARIELVFMPDRQGVIAFIQYTNGARDATVIHNRDIDENAPWAATMPAALRSSGHFRIQRIRNQPLEYHEGLKAATLKWVRSFADMEEAA